MGRALSLHRVAATARQAAPVVRAAPITPLLSRMSMSAGSEAASDFLLRPLPDAVSKESQRDSGPKPRVARNELPWVGNDGRTKKEQRGQKAKNKQIERHTK